MHDRRKTQWHGRERMEKAPKLKLAITAGIGSDHVDLNAAKDHNLTVGEATGAIPNPGMAA